ncbi:interleukin-1 beta [Anabas testudineus]|uniref:Interleukin-1 n=1 Tax=Anabas testudineus TaxID=64144 RepID=A0A3Q1HNA1_ANATE|nr:interleukin-1 beta [Anabas testudineus]
MEAVMTCNMPKRWNPKMPKGLDLEFTHHPISMRRVVNIIIALERLKARSSESVLGTEFRDENLLNLIFENIVEEQIVFECSSAPTDDYTRSDDMEHQCSVTDSKKRSLVLVQNSMELQAMMLQGGNDNRKVYLNMSTYMHPSPITEARPVALCIKGTNLYLSCHEDKSVPTLHLETVEDKSNLSIITSGSDMMRFLFYKRDTGVNISTLMSARFNGWYISTEDSDNKKVEMCQETAQRYTTFTIQHQS